jgi:hypothetical protein
MAVIRLKAPRGERPKIHATLLGETEAQVARNIRLERGTWRPLRAPSYVSDLSTVATVVSLFRYTPAQWFEWGTDVDAVRSMLPDDPWDRVYYTGDGAPKFTVNNIATSAGPFPSNSYDLGIPAPASAPLVAVSGTPTDATDPIESTYYLCTYIDAYGAEGAPSPVSTESEWQPGQIIDVSGLPGAPTGNYNIATLRVYRTNTGTYGSVYQKVVDLPIGTLTYTDSILSANLSSTTLESVSWDMPNPAMKGLIAMPGEFMVGFYGNVLAPSAAGQPHAYPPEYELKTDYDIVGIAAFGNTILVTTTGQPYIAQGVSPESMVLTKMEIAQACVSKRSVVDVGAGAVYASPDGVILMSSAGPQNLTGDIFDRDAWQSLNPTSIHACLWEGKYLAFYDDGTTKASFSVDPLRPQDGAIFYDRYVNAAYTALEEDALYIAQSGAPQTVSTWDSAASEVMTWRSKKFIVNSPTNFAAAQVRAEAYPVTLKLIVDGVEQVSQPVNSTAPFRLPSGFRGVEHEVDISGANQVYEIAVAQHLRELRNI